VADASRITGNSVANGAFVSGVSPAYPGEKAGLRKGDVITGINQRRVDGADDLERVLAGLTPGSRVTIILRRGQENLTSEIVV
jgi:S1-C subfamily serine protease